MSYIGNTPTNQNFVAGADQFNGDGSTTAFTLSRNVNTVFDIFVAISNVPQDPYSAYSVSGNTLTFTSAPPSGTGNIYVVYRATNVQTFVPTPGVSTQFGLGSATAPSMTFIGDTNTGIYSPGADTLAFVEGGTEAMRINSSANVGIGTSSPSGRLHVDSSAGSLPLYINSTASAQNVRVRLNSTDNASSVSYVMSYSHASLNKQASMLLGGTGAIGFYVNQTAGAEPTTGSLGVSIDTSANLQFNSGYGSVATAYGCRAWVNFNGTGTVAIRASGNVSSITDNGVGLYQVNFTSALVNANFAVVITGGGQGAGGSTYAVDAGSATTAKVNIRSRAVSGGAAVDEDPFSVAIFR